MTVLQMAALSGETALAKLLLDKGSIKNVRSTHGKPAFDFAVSFRLEAVAALQLSRARKRGLGRFCIC